MTSFTRLSCSAILLLLCNVPAALAASVSIVSSGTGTYVIRGDAMDGVSGIDLTLNYDSSAMSSPAVSQGGLISGALLAANTANTGAIKIAVVSSSTFSGSGSIATVTFASTKGAGGLTIVSANLIDAKGAPITAGISTSDAGSSSTIAEPSTTTPTANATNSTNSANSSASSPTLPSTTVTASGSAPSIYPGTMTMPTDTMAQSVPKPAESPAAPAAPAAETAPQMNAAPPEQPIAEKVEQPKKIDTPRSVTYIPVLERFHAFHGIKTPAALIALFGKDMPSSISQDPAVVLSDGATHVKITVNLAANGHSPNFALNGAALISLARGEQPDIWVVEALPQRNTVKASLTILNGAEEILFPLAVSPPVKTDIFSEAGFAAFLKNHGMTADLNNDGIRDYIDDYIYTANYLARKAETPPKTQPEHKTP